MKPEALKQIQQNIAEHGQHLYLISGGASPRFAYTIGLNEPLGVELVFAGGVLFNSKEVAVILNKLAQKLRDGSQLQSSFRVQDLGTFSFRQACDSWISALLLGALDYYRGQELKAYQVLPDSEHWTIDIPDLSKPWSVESEPVWTWYFEDWPFPVPRKSNAATNLAALRGERITEVARWEEDQWEMFAGPGPEVMQADMRVVPLGVLIGADRSNERVTKLAIGEALCRDDQDGEWLPWGMESEET